MKKFEITSEERKHIWECSDEKEAMDLHLEAFSWDRLLSVRRLEEEE